MGSVLGTNWKTLGELAVMAEGIASLDCTIKAVAFCASIRPFNTMLWNGERVLDDSGWVGNDTTA